MSHQGFDNTFSAFKQQFYSKIGDATCFDVLDINLLKVVLDGLKVQYTKRGKMSHLFNKSTFFAFIYFLSKISIDFKKRNTLKNKIAKIRNTKYIIGFSDRSITNENKEYSIYFQKIFSEFGREKFCYITKNKNAKVNADIDFSDLVFGFNVFSLSNIKLFFAIKKWLKNIHTNDVWTMDEIENIEAASFLFYINYLKFDYFFKNKKFAKAFLICHYHNEAFILACKRNNIIVNELQHGLIAKEDIFYVFPDQVSKVIHKALFPDTIFVYGDFWKNVLLNGSEYSQSDIRKIGYYHYEKPNTPKINISEFDQKKIILITTQYSAHQYFIDFINRLSPKLKSDWKIVVKLHPAETLDEYKILRSLTNVEFANGNLDEWILKSEFLITIFSTTIFDAIRLGKFSFSLNIQLYSDYVTNLVNIGASVLLNMNDNPVEKLHEFDKMSNSNEFYSEFNKACLQIS